MQKVVSISEKLFQTLHYSSKYILTLEMENVVTVVYISLPPDI